MTVIRQNHVGDSPHTIGKLLTVLFFNGYSTNPKEWPDKWWNTIFDLSKKSSHDKNISDEVGLSLQNKKIGSPYYKAWLAIVTVSQLENQLMYERLGVKLGLKDICGESIQYGLWPPMAYDYKYWSEKTGLSYKYNFPEMGDICLLNFLKKMSGM